MKVIGVTGNVGAGKSTFCGLLSKKGYKILNADNISKQFLLSDTPERQQVLQYFGTSCRNKTGNGLDFKKLAEIVFNNSKDLKYLNSILHPAVKRRVAKLLQDECQKDPQSVVFYESSLIYEVGKYDMIQKVAVVCAEDEVRMSRVKENRGWSQKEMNKREGFQLPQNYKVKLADYVIDNSQWVSQLECVLPNFIDWVESLPDLTQESFQECIIAAN